MTRQKRRIVKLGGNKSGGHIMKGLVSKQKEFGLYFKNSERLCFYAVICFKEDSDWKGGKSGNRRPVRKC